MNAANRALLFVFCALFAVNVAAQQRGNIEVKTVAEQEQVVVDETGEEVTRLVPVRTITPGEEVIYTISFTNISEDSAENVTITNAVPRHMVYVDNTAFGPGTDVTYSVDGGQTYGAPDELTVIDRDGSEKRATAANYTHIRWVMRHDLQPGSKGFARFRAQLK